MTGVVIHSSHKWTDIHLTQDYRVTFHLINDNILSSYPRGIISLEGTRELFKHYDQFLNTVGLEDRVFIEISDYSQITNIPSKRTRRVDPSPMHKKFWTMMMIRKGLLLPSRQKPTHCWKSSIRFWISQKLKPGKWSWNRRGSI